MRELTFSLLQDVLEGEGACGEEDRVGNFHDIFRRQISGTNTAKLFLPSMSAS